MWIQEENRSPQRNSSSSPSNETSSSRSNEFVIIHQLSRTRPKNLPVPFDGVDPKWSKQKKERLALGIVWRWLLSTSYPLSSYELLMTRNVTKAVDLNFAEVWQILKKIEANELIFITIKSTLVDWIRSHSSNEERLVLGIV